MPGKLEHQSGKEQKEALREAPLEQLLENHKKVIDASQERVNTLSGESIRAKLEALRKKNEFPALATENMPSSAEGLRKLLALTEVEKELEPTRQQIIDRVNAKIEAASPDERQKVYDELYEGLKEALARDVFLQDVLLKQRMDVAIDKHLKGLSEDAAAIKAGLYLVETGKRPEHLKGKPTPQEAALSLFFFNALIQGRDQQLISDISDMKIKDSRAFSKAAFPSYQAYVKRRGLDPKAFLPGANEAEQQAWFTKLCDQTNVEQRLNTINTERFFPIEDTKTFLEKIDKESGRFKALAKEARDEAKALESERDNLKKDRERILKQIEDLGEEGSPEIIKQLKQQVLQLEQRIQGFQEKMQAKQKDAERFDTMATKTFAELKKKGIDGLKRDHVMDHFVTGIQPDTRYLDQAKVLGLPIGKALSAPIKGINAAIDWVAEKMPEPTHFRDMDAAGLLKGAMKLGGLTTALVMLIKLGTPIYMSAHNNLITLDPKKLMNFPEELVKATWKSATDVGALVSLGAGVLTVGYSGDFVQTEKDIKEFIREDVAPKAEWALKQTGVRPDQLKEVVTSTRPWKEGFKQAADWLENGLGLPLTSASETILPWAQKLQPFVEKGKRGFQEYLWRPLTVGGPQAAQDFLKFTKEQWQVLGMWAERLGLDIDEYREYSDTVAALKDELNTTGPFGKEVTVQTGHMNVKAYNAFLLKYVDGNRNSLEAMRKPISVEELAQMNFVDRSVVRPGMKSFTPSQKLANALVKQGLWWEKHQPSA